VSRPRLRELLGSPQAYQESQSYVWGGRQAEKDGPSRTQKIKESVQFFLLLFGAGFASTSSSTKTSSSRPGAPRP